MSKSKLTWGQAGALASNFVLIIYQGAGTLEQKLAIRNTLLGLYFKSRVIDIKSVEGGGTQAIYENEDEKDLTDAHSWYNGITATVRRAPGDFNEEVAAAQKYIFARPATATV